MKTVLLLSIVLVIMILTAVGVYYYITAIKVKPALSIVGYYDENKQLISGKSQSVVNGVEGIRYVVFSLLVTNKDKVALDFKITDASPQEFKASLPLNQVSSANAGDSVTWKSGLIDISQFENTTKEFCFTSLGSSIARTSQSKISCINITVSPNPVASFDIILQSESNNTQNYEPPTNTQNNSVYIKFRTYDLLYGSSNAVAYSATCGGNLIAYGRTSGACTEHLCSQTNQDFEVPSVSGKVKVWVRSADELCVCQDGATSSYAYRYATSDTDSSKVSTIKTSTDLSKEITC